MRFSTKPFQFRFYRAGWSDRSDELVARIKSTLDERIRGMYNLEIIDVFFKPRMAIADGVYATPMLVKLSPLPVKKFFGCLNNVEELRKAFEVLSEDKRKMDEASGRGLASDGLSGLQS